MTRLLEKAFEKASELPEDEQGDFAAFILDELEVERQWEQAANGDQSAAFQVEHMFSYYHAVLGMYYDWQIHVLSGMSVSEAASKVTGTTASIGAGSGPPTWSGA